MGILIQIVATVILCFSCVNMGIMVAWPSSMTLLFKSENTTLHRPMTDMDVTLLGSLPLMGAFIMLPFLNFFVLANYGLKRTTMLTSLFFVVSWSIVAVSNRVEVVLFTMFIIGAGNAILLFVSMYISEIAQDRIRGTLSSGANLSCSTGLLISYLLGGILEYHIMVYTNLTLAVMGVIMISVLKESPVQLMAKGREEEAMDSMAFYHQTSRTSKEVLLEVKNIRRSLKKDFGDGQSLVQVAENVQHEYVNEVSWWKLFKSSTAIRRQFYLALALQTAFFYQGLPSLMVYAEFIFTETVGDTYFLSPNLCSVVFGIALIVAGVVGAYLSDYIGRRPLQIHFSIVAGICCLFLGTQIVLKWLPMWTIPLFIYLYTFAHTMGSGTVTFVLVAEIFVPEVKNELMMFTFIWGNMCAFSCNFLFGAVIQAMGLAPAFFFFSAVCFATSVYFFYRLPETKGLPVYAIQALFTKEVH